MSFLGQAGKLIIPKRETPGTDFVALNYNWEYQLRRRTRQYRWSANGFFLSRFDQYLVSAYKFETGAVLDDSKGNNTLHNYTSYSTSTSGKSGACLVCNGSNYGLYADADDFRPTQSVAISWWTLLNGATDEQVFLAGYDTHKSAYYGTSSRFSFYQSNNTLIYIDFTGYNYTNTWHHCVFLANGSVFRAYVNGSRVGSTSYNGTILTVTQQYLYIGTERSWSRSIDGKIDELYFWKNISIDTSDMDSFAAALYNNGYGAFWV